MLVHCEKTSFICYFQIDGAFEQAQGEMKSAAETLYAASQAYSEAPQHVGVDEIRTYHTCLACDLYMHVHIQ